MEKVLEIDGAVVHPLSLSVADLRERYPPCTVETSFSNGTRTVEATFRGARLWDVIASAQVTEAAAHDPKLRVMARAKDGFRCIVRWNEFDPAVTDRQVLIGYEQDGEPLASGGGPLRLVVPGDPQGRRYLRGLARITVLAQPPAPDEE